MWPYIIGEPTESGEVDMKMEEKEEEEKEKTYNLKNLTLVVWGAEKLRRKKKMSLDPRSSMANSSANDILMGQFPEQGSELVSWLPYSTYL